METDEQMQGVQKSHKSALPSQTVLPRVQEAVHADYDKEIR